MNEFPIEQNTIAKVGPTKQTTLSTINKRGQHKNGLQMSFHKIENDIH